MEIFNSSFFSSSDLMAYYRFESSNFVADSKGTRHLTNNNSVSSSSGKYGGGADFGSPNTNKYLSNSNSYWANGSPFTVCYWRLLGQTNGSMHGDWSFLSLSYEYYFGANISSNSLHFHIKWSNDTDYDWNISPIPSIFDPLSWQHHALSVSVSSGNTTMKRYINGVLVGQYTQNNRVPAGVNSLNIGRIVIENTYSTGKIDDFAIFTRDLTQQEIQEIYKDRSGSSFFYAFL